MEEKGLSRRTFLKSGAVSIGGIAAANLLGACSAKSVSSNQDTTASTSGAASEPEFISQAYLNPQDYDYTQATTDFATLFSPLKIGSIEIPCRIVKSAAGSATYINGPTDELLDYYVNFAKGGVPLIYVENIAWLEPIVTSTTTSGVVVTGEQADAFAKKLVEECAKYGATLGYQKGAAFDLGPADALSDEAIAASADRLVETAKWFKSMGFKAWECHVTGSERLANKFVSRFLNTRDDEYGPDSIENRCRFLVDIIKRVKQECGEDFVIQMLVEASQENDNITNNNGESFRTIDKDVTVANTLTTCVDEQIECCKLYEAAGADSIHLRIGIISYHPAQFASDLFFCLNGLEGESSYGWQWNFARHFQGEMIAEHSGCGMLLNIAKRFKEVLSIPIGAVTYMDPAHAPDFFEKALADGNIDFYELNRPLTVDPEYVNKLREGRRDEIAPCCRCLHCHIGSNEFNRQMGYCRVNALTQRVYTENGPANYELQMAKTTKNVMVIGGGPGGMEAARIAAARGHKVTLYEKTGALGGKLDFANIIKGPHENLMDLKAYLIRQLEVNGVTVETNKEVDAELITAEAPDAVVLATGGLYDTLKVAGDNSVPVIEYSDFMSTEMGDNIVIYGSNAQAWDCALWLTVRKKHITMVTAAVWKDVDKQQSQHLKRFMTTSLFPLGLQVWPESDIKEAADGKVVISAAKGSFDTTVDCDAIINASNLLPNTALMEGLSMETYAVGDCANPYNIALAIQTGNDAGRAL